MGAEEQLKILEMQVEMREKALGLEEKMLKAMKGAGDAEAEIAKQAQKVKELTEATGKINAANLKTQVSLEKSIANQSSGMMSMVGIVGMIEKGLGKIVDLVALYSKNTRDTADNLKLNVDEAKAMNTEILGAITGEKMALTTRGDSVQMMAALNAEYKGMVKFSGEQAVNMEITRKQLGISRTDAAAFSEMMNLSGDHTADMGMSMLAGVKSLSEASDVKFSAVMGDIAQHGKKIMTYFGKSAKEMGIMAVAARKLGFELSDIAGASEAMLDTEGRIEKQMIFNQMTGKKINLDKAAALMYEDDQVGALKEIQKQVGDISGLKSYQLKMLSEMTGLSTESLMNAEVQAELQTGEVDNTAMIMEMQTLMMENQTAMFEAQEISNQSAVTALEAKDNIQININDNLAEELGKRDKGNHLALIMQGIQIAMVALQGIAAVSTAMKARSEKKAAQAQAAQLPKLGVEAGVRGAGAAAALTTNAAVTFGVGTVIALAAAALGTVWLFNEISKAKAMKDGVITPDAGMVVSGPKGMIQLDKEDSIIAGTNLGGNGGGEGSGGGSSSKALLGKLDALIAATMGGKKVAVDGYQLNESIHLEKIPSGMS